MNVERWLIHTVRVAAFTGVDAAGDPIFAAQRKVKARVEKASKKVAAGGGKDVFSAAQVLTAERLGLQDRLWLPDTDHTDTDAALTPVALAEAEHLRGGSQLFMTYL